MLHAAATILASTLASAALGQAGVDPSHAFAWSENAGWINWAGSEPDHHGAHLHDGFLSGFVWSENTGWINVGNGLPTGDCDGTPCYSTVNGPEAGVNLDPDTGELWGLAWGENVGWINFGGGAMATPPNPARLDTAGNRLRGYAWGENIGWINLDDAEHFVAFAGTGCDAIDFNGDGLFPDTADIDDFLSVFSGGPCSTGMCGDIDFNNDGLFPDTTDIDSLLSVFSGGPCL
ncbi:MAG: hypothetical protein U0637_14370 [Phycisphaerales bacterium]